MEYSLEKFDKYLQTKGIETLIDQNEFGVCLSKNYSNIKAELLNIQVKLGEQFKNAKKEFADRDYLMQIDLDFQQRQNDLKKSKCFCIWLTGKKRGRKPQWTTPATRKEIWSTGSAPSAPISTKIGTQPLAICAARMDGQLKSKKNWFLSLKFLN